MRDREPIAFVDELQKLAMLAGEAWKQHQRLSDDQKALWGDTPLETSLAIHREIAARKWRAGLPQSD